MQIIMYAYIIYKNIYISRQVTTMGCSSSTMATIYIYNNVYLQAHHIYMYIIYIHIYMYTSRQATTAGCSGNTMATIYI